VFVNRMTAETAANAIIARPKIATVAELLKPITWFPPMWAFSCGVVSSAVPTEGKWLMILSGVVLVGPLVCASSQAVNDWFDREVDAINEPHRPIPSGRMPGRWGLYIAILWTLLSLMLASALGQWGFVATAFGLVLAWMYSAPPFRLKLNGWWGNLACAVCYEGLAWVTGAAVMAGGAMPDSRILLLAAMYSAGAHGIMTLNDFKAIAGDQQMGVRSLPVQLGPQNAARVACVVMALPQMVVVASLFSWGAGMHALGVAAVLIAQLWLMRTFLAQPVAKALWYSGLGVTLYVSGMMISAFALRGVS
jgi:chlorophyll synthase